MLLKLSPFIVLLWIVGFVSPIAEATTEKTAQQIFEEHGRAVVVVLNHGSGTSRQRLGSGFLVRPNGVFVTNFHVVERAAAVSIKLPNGLQLPVTGILALDRDNDIAILKVDAKNVPVVTLGNSDAVKVGQSQELGRTSATR